MPNISSIIIKETFPKDIYVDPYQVSGNDKIIIKEPVDCEFPAYLASVLEVKLCSISKISIHEICLPIHFRYQVPHSCKMFGETVTVHMAVPSVSVYKIDNHSSDVSLGCFRTTGSLIYDGYPSIEPLSFEIPVGCSEDLYSVLFLSAIVIPMSAAYLSLKLIKTNEILSAVMT